MIPFGSDVAFVSALAQYEQPLRLYCPSSTGRSSAGSSGEWGPSEWGWPGQGAQARPWIPALASNSKNILSPNPLW